MIDKHIILIINLNIVHLMRNQPANTNILLDRFEIFENHIFLYFDRQIIFTC